MLTIRRDGDIWRERGPWFLARWHFSFDRYRDPENDGSNRKGSGPAAPARARVASS